MVENVQAEAVAVLGLGSMGKAVARSLARDAEVIVWNRTQAKAEGLSESGIGVASTASSAIEASRIVIVSLVDNAAVRRVLKESSGALRSRLIVNLTNGTPDEARKLADAVATEGGRYLHGAVMAVPPMVGTPAATILCSGVQEAFQQTQPLLAKLGNLSHIGEDPGRAPLFELALLSIMYGLYGGFFHAGATVAAEGQSINELAKLAVPWATGLAGALPRLAQQMSIGSYDQNVSSTLTMQAKGLDHFSEWGTDHQISGVFIEPMRKLMNARISEGLGGHGIASIFELVRKR